MEVGVGDDAAVITSDSGDPLLVTTDAICDGVDFHLAEVGPRLAGRKAMAVCLSDIAAMGGRPTVAVATVTAPVETRLAALQDLYLGMKEVADEFDVQIVGGDSTSWEGALAISVTCLGRGQPVLRSGARIGDAICVTGRVGGSILGRHLDFTPRVREVAELRSKCTIHSMIDISDGLARDLHHILEASAVGAEIDGSAVPISEDAQTLARRTGKSPLDHALADGEDFELLFTLSKEASLTITASPPQEMAITRIGTIVKSGCTIHRNGAPEELPPMGYVHEFR
ncbi:MAG: thiamine-phosphate kinase [Planctomycetota bacterium]|nr:thiamine-phosphate kinase [Planctomycetota bacterium]